MKAEQRHNNQKGVQEGQSYTPSFYLLINTYEKNYSLCFHEYLIPRDKTRAAHFVVEIVTVHVCQRRVGET